MPCGWEGNRRSWSGHASQTLMVLHLRAQGLEEGDEHPPTLSCGAWSTLCYFTCLCFAVLLSVDGSDVKTDTQPTPTSVAPASSSAKSRPVDIENVSADRDRDSVTADSRQCRQSYASVVSTRRDGPHDMDLPCPGAHFRLCLNCSVKQCMLIQPASSASEVTTI